MKKVILMAFHVLLMAQGRSVPPARPECCLSSPGVMPGDVVITEIMADPVPSLGLPGEEYLEILNRSRHTIDLTNWRLSSATQHSYFPEISIEPGEYLILCAVSDTGLFTGYGRVAGLKPFPALTNRGRLVLLYDDRGNLINGVDYSSNWYGNSLKSKGGWSLEIIDPGFPFFGEGNWEASSDRKGGTPGKINSAHRSNPDNSFRGITNVFPADNMKIIIEFSEPLIGFGNQTGSITVGESPVTGWELSDPLYRSFTLIPGLPLERGRIYTLGLPAEISDFAGNRPAVYDFRFGIPEPAGAKDLVFNELLFNPLPDNPDYIEFVNISGKILDASEFMVSSVKEGSGAISDPLSISTGPRCIIPGTCYTITTDRLKVISGFPLSAGENIHEVPALPSMPDARGHLLLMNRQLERIDEVIYSEKMHYSLLSGKEGISLEKIRPELPSDERTSWHSASGSSGWGTPGNRNSVFTADDNLTETVVLSSRKISPDNDGHEDVLVIGINSDDPGSIVSVLIFDETGSCVRKLAENHLAGFRASLVWDGCGNDGRPVRRGIYILAVEIYNAGGRVSKWKKVCAVI